MYYHIVHGAKVSTNPRPCCQVFSCNRQVFYFIRPTPANLAAYERWSGTEVQNHQWLGDMCDEVFKVELQAGNTMIIPTGWIHAVVGVSPLCALPTVLIVYFSSIPQRIPLSSEGTLYIRIMWLRVSWLRRTGVIISRFR